ncbi:MAG: DNA repair protein RadC [Bacteroidales bacterium]
MDKTKKYAFSHSIKTWAEDDRPREKLLVKSAKALSDAELLAILIRSGTQSDSAVDVSKSVLASVNNNLLELSRLGIKELIRFKGIGDVKAITIIAALELGRRRRLCERLEKKKITCSKDAYEIIEPIIGDNIYEEFWIILLNQRNHVIKTVSISHGSSSGTVVDPKKVFSNALDNNANALILCHNHPSGEVNPSQADINITKKCVEAGRFLELNVLDHIIVSQDIFFSFADEGLL